MHETNEKTDSERLDSIIEGLDILNETLMACMVQLSRIYDITATEYYAERSRYGPEAQQLLQGHEKGDIFTTAPVLRSFGVAEDEEDEDVSDDN